MLFAELNVVLKPSRNCMYVFDLEYHLVIIRKAERTIISVCYSSCSGVPHYDIEAL